MFLDVSVSLSVTCMTVEPDSYGSLSHGNVKSPLTHYGELLRVGELDIRICFL
jgi:hypothetical protein